MLEYPSLFPFLSWKCLQLILFLCLLELSLSFAFELIFTDSKDTADLIFILQNIFNDLASKEIVTIFCNFGQGNFSHIFILWDYLSYLRSYYCYIYFYKYLFRPVCGSSHEVRYYYYYEWSIFSMYIKYINQ